MKQFPPGFRLVWLKYVAIMQEEFNPHSFAYNYFPTNDKTLTCGGGYRSINQRPSPKRPPCHATRDKSEAWVQLFLLIFVECAKSPMIDIAKHRCPYSPAPVVARVLNDHHAPRQLWGHATRLVNNYSTSPNGLWVNSPWGRRPNGPLTHGPWGRVGHPEWDTNMAAAY